MIKGIAWLALLLWAQNREGEIRLLRVGGRNFRFERVGSITSFHCAPPIDQEDCELLERLDLQPQVDWERLLDRARKAGAGKAGQVAAYETVVDRYGGPWIVALIFSKTGEPVDFLRRFRARIGPDFPGYKIEFGLGGSVSRVEVLRKKEHWEQERREIGADESGRRRKRGWLE
ncbi:MAG: hypothetical protein HY549_00215 [Elusimicrobia bacterium]|nr:hypothetical protein [Elusimicrobiota bacterium]